MRLVGALLLAAQLLLPQSKDLTTTAALSVTNTTVYAADAITTMV